ncbi:40S ribosomal protein SA [Vulpes lagopus]
MHGTISCEHLWEVRPDLYLYRDLEEIEKEVQATTEKAIQEFQGEWMVLVPEFTGTSQPEVADWSEDMQMPSVLIQKLPTEGWFTASTPQATEWVGTITEWS